VIPSPDLQDFVRRYFERRAGPLKEEEPGVFLAVLPESLRPAFEGVDAIRLTFDPDLAASRGQVDLAAVGSYLMDRIIEDATRTGWHCVARFEAGAVSPREVVARAVRPRNATLSVDATETASVPHLLFNFRVRLTTDERVERLESVLVDTRTARERPVVAALFEERLALPEEVGFEWTSVGSAYRSACRILEARIDPEVREFRTQAEALLKAELERIGGYFDRSIRELQEARAGDARAEVRAFELERDRRLAEAQEKYRLVGEVELCNVRTVLLDVTMAAVSVSNRGARKEIPLEYDAASLDLPPIACEVCGTPTPEPVLCFGGHLAGPECVRGCDLCDRVHCRTCIATEGAIAACTVCRRSICPDHLEVCALSQRPYCPDHVHTCAICGRTVGPPYMARCQSCEQSYCVVCVRPPAERCATCRGLTQAGPDDPEVAAVRRSDPALAKVSRWRRGSNQRFTVLAAKGLVWGQLVVLDAKGRVLLKKRVRGA
jgi:hypothetical protein